MTRSRHVCHVHWSNDMPQAGFRKTGLFEKLGSDIERSFAHWLSLDPESLNFEEKTTGYTGLYAI